MAFTIALPNDPDPTKRPRSQPYSASFHVTTDAGSDRVIFNGFGLTSGDFVDLRTLLGADFKSQQLAAALNRRWASSADAFAFAYARLQGWSTYVAGGGGAPRVRTSLTLVSLGGMFVPTVVFENFLTGSSENRVWLQLEHSIRE